MISVGLRLSLLNAAVVAVAMAGLGALLFAIAERALLRGVDGIARDELEEVAHAIAGPGLDAAVLRKVVDDEVAEHQSMELAFRVTRADAAPLVRSASPVWDAIPWRPDPPPARLVRVAGDEYRHRVVARRLPTASFGAIDLEAAVRLRSVDKALKELLEGALLAAPFVLLTALAAGYFLSRRALAAIDRIERTARRIGAGRPGERVPRTGTGDEVDRLAGTLNGMLERLEAAAERNLRFAGDVAHEIRTPLATCRARLESALAEPDGMSASARAKVEHAVGEGGRLEALVKNLLLVTRADEGEARLARAPIDLAPIIGEVAAFFGPLAAARGIAFEVDAPGDLRLAGDAPSLQRALGNLVDNALRYTDRGGEVRIRARRTGAALTLEVEDSGCGVPPEERAQVFERFFRAASGRPRNPDGSGLGLALVRSVARAHGGDAGYAPRAGGGSVFRIDLPGAGATGPAPPPGTVAAEAGAGVRLQIS